mmetsp:Transcript_10256/g.21031  ORF Transcript_10256/g.21031 Transcript_10256/m.21031 type:complete len:242 (-) Transcript_10256:762-1487(-)
MVHRQALRSRFHRRLGAGRPVPRLRNHRLDLAYRDGRRRLPHFPDTLHGVVARALDRGGPSSGFRRFGRHEYAGLRRHHQPPHCRGLLLLAPRRAETRGAEENALARDAGGGRARLDRPGSGDDVRAPGRHRGPAQCRRARRRAEHEAHELFRTADAGRVALRRDRRRRPGAFRRHAPGGGRYGRAAVLAGNPRAALRQGQGSHRRRGHQSALRAFPRRRQPGGAQSQAGGVGSHEPRPHR